MHTATNALRMFCRNSISTWSNLLQDFNKIQVDDSLKSNPSCRHVMQRALLMLVVLLPAMFSGCFGEDNSRTSPKHSRPWSRIRWQTQGLGWRNTRDHYSSSGNWIACVSGTWPWKDESCWIRWCRSLVQKTGPWSNPRRNQRVKIYASLQYYKRRGRPSNRHHSSINQALYSIITNQWLDGVEFWRGFQLHQSWPSCWT